MIGNQDRWSASLLDLGVRQTFLDVCRRITDVTRAKEILLLPEGTVLDDLLYDNASIDEFKNRANEIWGEADLDVHRVYTESEIRKFDKNRVHYFSIPA